MKKHEIKVGGKYLAKVSGKLVVVRVDAIREIVCYVGSCSSGKTREQPRYDVTNLTTGRRLTFRSAAKFHHEVRDKPCPQCNKPVPIGEDYPFGMHRDCYERSNAAKLDRIITSN